MAKSFIGMNGFNPNEYAKFDNGINVYTCITTENNHALTGNGNNIKFVADAPYNEGDTITVNGETVSAQTQDGQPLQPGAWADGATVVCYLDGTTLNFKGGGGTVTVEGLAADVVKSGTTVTVKQGTKVVASVTGNLLPSDQNSCLAASWNKVYDFSNTPMMANNITDDSPISVTANKITVKRDFKAYIYKQGWCWPTTNTQNTGTSNIPTGQQSFTAGESFNVNLPIGHGNNQTSGILIIFAVNG